MATGAFTLNTKMQTNLASGLLDFSTGTWKAILLASTAPVATAETYADVSSYQPSNAGYAEASVTCSVTGSGSNVVSFGDASFTASGGSYTARYIAYYETGASLLAGYMLLDENAVDITINNGETVTISAPNAIIIGTTYVLEVCGQTGVVELDGTNLYVDDNASPLVSIKDELNIKYGTDNPPPYPVTSVNTMTGDVVFEYDHRNLLDNPFFTVNQRGASSYDTGLSSGYGYDRWWNIFANVSKDSDGDLVFTQSTSTVYGGVCRQAIELPSRLAGKTVTFSVDVKSYDAGYLTMQMYTGTGINSGLTNLTGSIVIDHVGINSVTITLPDSIPAYLLCNINIAIGHTATIRSLKLELGDISTLQYDTAPNYAEELAKCQRFYIGFESNTTMWIDGIAMGTGGTSIQSMISTPVTMRAVPSITANNLNIWDVTSSISVSNPTSAQLVPNGIKFNFTSASATNREAYIMFIYNGYLRLSADL